MNKKSVLKKSFAVIIAVLLCFTAVPHSAAFAQGAVTYYVSDATGSDSNDGRTLNSAFKTISKAESVMSPGDTCIIQGGVYRETLTVEQSGDATTTFKSYNGEEVVISGGKLIEDWQATENPNIWKTTITEKIHNGDGNMVFADGQLCYEARWPNIPLDFSNPDDAAHPLLQRGTYARLDSGGSVNEMGVTLTDSDLSQLQALDLTGAHVWCSSGWGYWSYLSEVLAHDAATNTLTLNKDAFSSGSTYYPGAQNHKDLYYITRSKALLDCKGEWFKDEGTNTLYYHNENGEKPQNIEFKVRDYAVNIKNSQNVVFDGISVRGAYLKFDNASSGCTFKNAVVETTDYRLPSSGGQGTALGVMLYGTNNTIANCEIKNMNGEGVDVKGARNRVLNCYIHDINFEHTYSDGIYLSGKNHLASHNTIKYAGRGTIGGRFEECVISYNDVSEGSRLSKDSGIMYFNAHNYENSEIHHNVLRDSCNGEGIQQGLYLDSFSKGLIIYKNLIYNMEPLDGSATSNDSALISWNSIGTVFANNTIINTNGIGFNPDLSGFVFVNNLFRGAAPDEIDKMDTLGDGIVSSNNLFNGDYWTDLANKNFSLKSDTAAIDGGIYVPGINDGFIGAAPDCGAFESGESMWTDNVGYDFTKDYSDVTFKVRTQIPGRNYVKNNGFENSLTDWEVSGETDRLNISSWTSFASISKDGDYALTLGTDGCASQTVTGLKPYTEYEVRGYAVLGSDYNKSTKNCELVSGEGFIANKNQLASNETVLKYSGIEFKDSWNALWMGFKSASSGATVDVWFDNYDESKAPDIIVYPTKVAETQYSIWQWSCTEMPSLSQGVHDVYFKINGAKNAVFDGFYFDEQGGDETVEFVAVSDCGQVEKFTSESRRVYKPAGSVTVTTGASGTIDVSIMKKGQDLNCYVDCISVSESYNSSTGYKFEKANLNSIKLLDATGKEQYMINPGASYTISGVCSNISDDALSATLVAETYNRSDVKTAESEPVSLNWSENGDASFEFSVIAAAESGSYFKLCLTFEDGDVLEHNIDKNSLQNIYEGGAVFVRDVYIKDGLGGDIIERIVPGQLNVFEISTKNLTDIDLPMTGILAVYNQNGVLSSTTMISRVIRAGSFDTYLVGKVLPDAQGSFVKIFTWNSLGNMTPVIESFTFK